MRNILVVDGNSILNRAFYGIRPLNTASGQPTAAIFGMLNSIKRQMDALKPEYAAVAFDVHAPTFRHEAYADYKAGRRPTPPELLSQFSPAKECLVLWGLNVLEMAGWEADDLQGTVARMAHAEKDLHAYILTGDRDLLQLIDDKTTVLLVGAETVPMNRDAFYEKYGVEPEQFVDVKAVMGDTSDHIPGVPGIGEKGALKLISAFGSLDGIYENIDSPEITKGVREKLLAGKQSAYDSRFLAKICTEVPFEKSLEELRVHPMDNDGLYRKFTELEFTALMKKFGVTPPMACECAATECSVDVPAACYGEADASVLTRELGDVFAVEMTDDGFAFYNGKRGYLYRGETAALAPVFNGAQRVIAADAKRLLHALWSADCAEALVPCDVLLAAYVRNAGGGAPSVSSLASQLLDYTPAEGEPIPHVLWALWEALEREVTEIGCGELLQTELALCPVLARMERVGFRLDVPAMEAFGKQLFEGAAELEQSIYAVAGESFNIQSPKQLSEVLFDKLCLPTGKAKRNKSGFYPTDADTLASLRHVHPIADMVLEYRHLSKLYATYAVGLVKVADENGRIHTDFKQALTATGRLSSAEPNLQNIPVRTKLGRQMRRCFITEGDDYVLVDADYSQIELRLLAAIAKDERMCEAFLTGEDIHRKTAAAVFRVPEEAVTEEMRKYAKAVNFGIVYGISDYSLSFDIGVTVKEAGRYKTSYFEEYPRVKEYLEKVVEEAQEKGYTQTLFGRRRYIPELSSSNFALRGFGKRVAMNSPIQGTAADVIKIAMVRVDRRLREEGLDARLVMQVHDELIVECHKNVAERVAALLKEEMEKAADVGVPLTAEVSVGETWLEE